MTLRTFWPCLLLINHLLQFYEKYIGVLGFWGAIR